MAGPLFTGAFSKTTGRIYNTADQTSWSSGVWTKITWSANTDSFPEGFLEVDLTNNGVKCLRADDYLVNFCVPVKANGTGTGHSWVLDIWKNAASASAFSDMPSAAGQNAANNNMLGGTAEITLAVDDYVYIYAKWDSSSGSGNTPNLDFSEASHVDENYFVVQGPIRRA